MSDVRSLSFALAGGLSLALSFVAEAHHQDPFADSVVSFAPGRPRDPLYADPNSALGSPERFTGEGLFPSVVSPFNPAFGLDEIIAIAPGGHITLAFDEPVENDPSNPYGIDLLIFGNTGFIDDAYPSGLVGGVFGADGGMVEVSADGVIWVIVPRIAADGLMPTLGYLDSGPYDLVAGSIVSDFTRPVDPRISLAFLLGQDFEVVRELYRGSGGGAGIDLASVGLASISFVRMSNPRGSGENIELDAVSDVSPRTPGDIDLDGDVDTDDLLALLGAWGVPPPGSPPADFDGNGDVDTDDLLTLLGNWSP